MLFADVCRWEAAQQRKPVVSICKKSKSGHWAGPLEAQPAFALACTSSGETFKLERSTPCCCNSGNIQCLNEHGENFVQHLETYSSERNEYIPLGDKSTRLYWLFLSCRNSKASSRSKNPNPFAMSWHVYPHAA